MPASTSANLATKPENGGIPARLSAGTRNSTAITGAVRTMLPRRLQAARAADVLDQAAGEEQRRLDHDVVHDVEDRGGDARRR